MQFIQLLHKLVLLCKAESTYSKIHTPADGNKNNGKNIFKK